MRFKRILILGLLILSVLATLPAVNAATYNVSNYEELETALHERYESEIVINLKNNITIKASDINNLPYNYIMVRSPVIFNGNNHSISIVSDEYILSHAVFDFGFNGSVVINDLVVCDSVVLADTGLSIFTLRSTRDSTSLTVNNLVVQNVSGLVNGTFANVKVFSFSNAGHELVRIKNFTFRNSEGIAFFEHGGGSHVQTGDRVRIENGIVDSVSAGYIIGLLNINVSNVTFSNCVVNNYLVYNGVQVGDDFVYGIDNCSFINNTVNGTVVSFNSYGSESFLINSYFENNTICGAGAGSCIVSLGNKSVIKHCTFVDNAVYGVNGSIFHYRASFNFVSVFFNTFVNNYIDEPNFGLQPPAHNVIYGNLFINGNFMSGASISGNSNLISNSYEFVFGSNKPALNGGKTKNIQLVNNGSNPALNKISAADYLVAVGVDPSADKDQAGNKRISGGAVDYGAVEYQKNPVQSIIDDIFNPDPGENPKENEETRPSLIKFLFGEGSIFDKTSSLLYYIMNNYVQWDKPVISPVHQKMIDVLGLKP
jgi:hypothetical protein